MAGLVEAKREREREIKLPPVIVRKEKSTLVYA